MRTSLINAYSTRNVGDAAIYRALATLSESSSPLYCRLEERSRLEIPGVEFHGGAQRNSDLYISVGGDIFNNARPRMLTRNFAANLRTLGAPPAHRTIVFGQSIPRSCRGLAFRMLARRLRGLASVTVRDAESHRRLRRAGVNARLSYDAAFILRPEEWGRYVARVRFHELGIKPEQAAVLSIRAFDNMYPVSNRGFLAKMIRLCQLLDERGFTPVILMQSDAHGADNDRTMLSEIVRQVPAVRHIDPFASALPAHPWETAIAVLELARVAVAVRYHTAIFRALSGRAAYSLYYSNKGEDLVARLGMPGQSVEDFDPGRDIDDVIAGSASGFDIGTVRMELKRDFDEACFATHARWAA